MKTLSGTIIFSLSVVTFIIGIHQTMVRNSIQDTYPLFTLSGGLFLLYLYMKVQRKEKEQKEQAQKMAQGKRPKPKKKR